MSATLEALLAMKLNAARARDTADLAWLLDELGIDEFAVAEEIFERYYPGDGLKPAAAERLRFLIDQRASQPSDRS